MNEAVRTTGAAADPRRRGMPVPKGGRAASQVAACVLEVLAGVRTPAEAAGELGVSLPRYYHWSSGRCKGWCRAASRGRGAGWRRRRASWRGCGGTTSD